MAQSIGSSWAGASSGADNATPAMVTSAQGSTYIPMDHWIYDALDRLHGMGYIDTAFLGLRPWTRLSIAHMLEESADSIQNSSDDEARELFLAIRREVQPDVDNPTTLLHPDGMIESVYAEARGISGTSLRDGFHLGQTIVNDYGRPYEEGFNFYGGGSARAEAGRFSLYFRGEYQHSPSADGYSPALRTYLSDVVDTIDLPTHPEQETLPDVQIKSQNNARLMEGYVSYQVLNHEVSFGKMDHWLSPARGGALLISDNAQNAYEFQIDRIEPLHVPGLSKITGPFRYLFYVGSLKGHTEPNAPWEHVEKISFKPYRDLEFGFSRLVIWGGKDHVPITLHSFLKSFFSVANVSAAEKFSRDDPGARFAAFDFNWRLPFMRHWITLYTDSFVHDDVSPVDAPRRAAYHPGIYLSRVPGLQHLDVRAEAATTDASAASDRNKNGQFFYWEVIQKQGPTNEGYLLGDWIGRNGKGGQAWATWHFSPKDEVGVSYRHAKASQQYLTGGTTQNAYAVSAKKWFAKQFQVEGSVQYETWTVPVYKTGQQSDTTVTARFTWFPPRKN
jgi:hypothetical protein